MINYVNVLITLPFRFEGFGGVLFLSQLESCDYGPWTLSFLSTEMGLYVTSSSSFQLSRRRIPDTSSLLQDNGLLYVTSGNSFQGSSVVRPWIFSVTKMELCNFSFWFPRELIYQEQ